MLNDFLEKTTVQVADEVLKVHWPLFIRRKIDKVHRLYFCKRGNKTAFIL